MRRDATGTSTVAAIGVFDGVHLGHQALLRRARRDAVDRGCRMTAITFHPHPLAVVAPDRAPRLLMSIGRRQDALLAAGADDVVVLPFDAAMAAQTPEQFVDEVLLRHGVVQVVVGEDFRFGANASGDVATLAALGDRRGFSVTAVAIVTAAAERVSSTGIRHHLSAGRVAAVAGALGRPHAVEGHLGHRGSTVILRDATGLLPATGEYIVTVVSGGQAVPGAASVADHVVTLHMHGGVGARVRLHEQVLVTFEQRVGEASPLHSGVDAPARHHRYPAGTIRHPLSQWQTTGVTQ